MADKKLTEYGQPLRWAIAECAVAILVGAIPLVILGLLILGVAKWLS
jgi:hypothetical protein